jgi:hypothetical protein
MRDIVIKLRVKILDKYTIMLIMKGAFRVHMRFVL